MKLYWKNKKNGLDLIVDDEQGNLFSVGGVRKTKRGIEALAKTTGYDPGRAIKGLNTLEEGKNFVEGFEPWREFFPSEKLEIDAEIAE